MGYRVGACVIFFVGLVVGCRKGNVSQGDRVGLVFEVFFFLRRNVYMGYKWGSNWRLSEYIAQGQLENS